MPPGAREPRSEPSFGAGGAAAKGEAQRILIEFVSANPTGPMHVGHARNAAYGDALARMLAFHGHSVAREFYINDAGSQIVKFGESVAALARGQAVPEDGYHGDYVGGLAGGAAGRGDAAGVAGSAARRVAVMLERMRASLAAFGVLEFDHWQHESALHDGDPSPVEHTLGGAGRAGADLLPRRARCGCARPSSETTRTACSSAPAASTPTSPRTPPTTRTSASAASSARSTSGAQTTTATSPARRRPTRRSAGDPDELELLIMQLVHLVRSGDRAQMSKRAGEFVTLDELVEEIGVDAARWYLLARSHDTTVDLDLDLAREQSAENPVYYVQYAHARIASMLERAGAPRVEAGARGRRRAPGGAAARAAPLRAGARAAAGRLPGVVAEAVARRAPHRIAAYALELAQGFTAFYRDCRVVGAEPEAVESFRIALSVAVDEHDLARAGPARRRRAGPHVGRLSRSARGPTRAAPRRRLRAEAEARRSVPRDRRRQRGSSTASTPAERQHRSERDEVGGHRRSRGPAGSPSTVEPYCETSAVLIWASFLPSSISDWM